MRSFDRSLFSIGFFSNKYLLAAVLGSLIILYLALTNEFLVNIFSFVPLDRREVIEAIALSSLVLVVGELYKLRQNSINKNKV